MPDTSSQSDAVKTSLAGPVPPQPRPIGAINWLGLWTLYKKEVRRFLKVSFQTVAAPVATTLLYMMVFSLAIGVTREAPGGLPFVVFLAPGLVMMGLLNNAFANSSSSLIVAKVQGNTVDFLMPPLSAGELAAAFIGGAITRGVMVAAASALVIMPFASVPVSHVWAIVFFGVGAAAMLGMAGVIAGVWAEKFDHLAVITNFIIMPLTFLSGTFYSISILPEPFQTISHANPFFYLIDGFRYGFIGYADGNIAIGVVVTLVINAALLVACYGVLRSGWRLRT
ncbi:ABC transporter permease [Glycocaulis abyssi]|uniref:Transport permease protein n=1 Tax=Glycocaulis abyssi TaxID=1433403 RepID=A0ABV9NCA3_9PROT